MTGPLVIRDDNLFVRRTGVWVRENYTLSTLSSVELWSGQSRPGLLAFEYMGKNISTAKSAKYYPGSSALPVVSDELRAQLETVLSPTEAFFFPCSIVKQETNLTNAWCLVPRHQLWCVDKEQSIIDWLVPDLKPEEIRIRSSKKVVLKPNCMDGLNIARMKESETSLLASNKLYELATKFNVDGLQFLPTNEAVFGF